MARRRDALLGAARCVELVNRIGHDFAPNACATVGVIENHPNSRNVIPGQCYLTIDLRHPDDGIRAEMDAALREGLARIDEKDRPALFAWLEVLKEELGVEVLVSDDFNSYSTAARRLELDHQICRFHYLRWVNRLLNRLQKQLDDEWADALDEVRQLLEDLPPNGGQRIFQLYRQVQAPPRIRNQPMSPLSRLQKLLLRLSDNWSSYRLFLEQDDVPATNNASERTIGRWRIRSRSVRGFKSWSGLVNAFTLCNSAIV